MSRSARLFIPLAFLALAMGYVLAWPIGADPVAWASAPAPGYQGPHARNERLARLRVVGLKDGSGPEHVARGPDGMVYAGLDNGIVVRMFPDGTGQQQFANTGGRVLGFDFDRSGHLIAADAYKGLLSISPQGQVSVLTREVAPGDPIRYADAVAIGPGGLVYFTEGSQRFAPGPWGNPFEASVAEILEQRGNGRVLVHDPVTRRTEVIAEGLVFANGIAVSSDGQALLVVETGRYRVWLIDIAARRLDVRRGGGAHARVLLDNLPAFPDNLTKSRDGWYWLGLPQPRSTLADALAPMPWLRAVFFRLPHFLLPVPRPYGHAIAFTEDGAVQADLQDPSGRFPDVTGVTESSGSLFVHSLVAGGIGTLPWPDAARRPAERP